MPTDPRDRLLAALIAEDPTMVLLRWDPGVAVLLVTEDIRHIVLVTVPDGTPEDRLREALAAQVKTVQQGRPPTDFVAVGGGPEVAAALNDAAPFVEPARMGFHHVGAGNAYKLVKGKPLPVLDRALRRVDREAPVDPAPIAAALARGKQLAETERAVAGKLTGRHAVTAAITVICVVLAGLGFLWGGADGYHLAVYQMGVNGPVSLRGGEPWRLLSSAFLHAGVVHLLMNMVALWSFGPMLEAILGPRRYLLLYGASALGGSLASALLGGDRWSVGASGAIWGLMTAFIALAMWPKGVLPPLMTKNLKRQVWMPLVLNIAISLDKNIDFLAHLGGGVVGFALTATVLTEGLTPVAERRTPADIERRPRPIMTAAAAIVAGLMAISVGMGIWSGRPWEVAASVPPK